MSECLGCACCGRLILVERQLEDTQKDLELCREQSKTQAAAEQLERTKELNGLKQELSIAEAKVKGKEALIEQLKAGIKDKKLGGNEKLEKLNEKLEGEVVALKQKLKAAQSEKDKLERGNDGAVQKLAEMSTFLKQLMELKAKYKKLEKENATLKRGKGVPARPNGITPHTNGVANATTSSTTSSASIMSTASKTNNRSVAAKKSASGALAPPPAPTKAVASTPVPALPSSDTLDEDDFFADLGDALDSESEHSSPVTQSLSTPPLPVAFAKPAPRSPAVSHPLPSSPSVTRSPVAFSQTSSFSPISPSSLSRNSVLSPRKPSTFPSQKTSPSLSVSHPSPSPVEVSNSPRNGPQSPPPLSSVPASPTLSESGDMLSQLSQMTHSSVFISPLQGGALPPIVNEPPTFNLPPSVAVSIQDDQSIVSASQPSELPLFSSSPITPVFANTPTTFNTDTAAKVLTSLSSATSTNNSLVGRPASPTHSAALSLTQLSQSPRISPTLVSSSSSSPLVSSSSFVSSSPSPLVIPSTSIVASEPTPSEAGMLSQLQQLSHVSVAISPLGPIPKAAPQSLKASLRTSKRPLSTRIAPNVNGARRKPLDASTPTSTSSITTTSSTISSPSTINAVSHSSTPDGTATQESKAVISSITTTTDVSSTPTKASTSPTLVSESPILPSAELLFQKPKRRHGSLAAPNSDGFSKANTSTSSKKPRAAKTKTTSPENSTLTSQPPSETSSHLPSRARPTYPPNFLAPFQLEDPPPFLAATSDHSEFVSGVKQSLGLLHSGEHLDERVTFILSSLEKTVLSTSILPAPLCLAIVSDVLQSVITSNLTQQETLHAYAVLVCRLSNFLSKRLPSSSASTSEVNTLSSASSVSTIPLLGETVASVCADAQFPSFCRVTSHDSLVDLFILCVISVLIKCSRADERYRDKVRRDSVYHACSSLAPSFGSTAASSSSSASSSSVAASSVACAIALTSVLSGLHKDVHQGENGLVAPSGSCFSCTPANSLVACSTTSLEQSAQNSLVKLVAFVCLQEGRLYRLRAFCAELFLSCSMLPIESIAAVAQIWPEVFTLQHDSLLSQSLRTTFLLSYQERIRCRKISNPVEQSNLDSPSWDEVFHIVSQNPSPSVSHLAEKCLNILSTDIGYFAVLPLSSSSSSRHSNSGEFVESLTALHLLACTQGFLWTYNVLIRDLLWKKLCNCSNVDLLPGLLASLGVLLRTGLPYLQPASSSSKVSLAVSEAVCSTRDLLSSFLTSHFPLSVQLSAALSISGTIDQGLQNYEPIANWFHKLNKDEKAQLRASRHCISAQNFMFMEKVFTEA